MRVEILKEDEATRGLPFLIEIKAYENGIQIIPSSAAVTVKSPAGEKVVDSEEMSVDQSGTMTYSVAGEKISELWENALIEVVYTENQKQYKSLFYFDVVICPLKPTVTDEDLKKYFPQLGEELWSGELNYDKQIQEAFRLIKRDIRDKGRRPAMLIDGMQVRELLIIKAFELIFFDFAKSDEDIWWKRYEEMKQKYKDQFERLVIKYDQNEDELIDWQEKATSLGQITLER